MCHFNHVSQLLYYNSYYIVINSSKNCYQIDKDLETVAQLSNCKIQRRDGTIFKLNHVLSTHGYKSSYAKLVLHDLALYYVPVQSTVSLFWFYLA